LNPNAYFVIRGFGAGFDNLPASRHQHKSGVNRRNGDAYLFRHGNDSGHLPDGKVHSQVHAAADTGDINPGLLGKEVADPETIITPEQ